MNSRSPVSALRALESPRYPPSQTGSKAKQAPVAARKLAATLWEMNEIPLPSIKETSDDRRSKKEKMAFACAMHACINAQTLVMKPSCKTHADPDVAMHAQIMSTLKENERV